MNKFSTEVNLKESNHEIIFKWFDDYLSTSAYCFNIFSFNILNQIFKKEVGDKIDQEYIEVLDETIEFLVETRKFLNEK